MPPADPELECPACGYLLHGLEGVRRRADVVCPECGLRPGVAASRIETRRRRSMAMVSIAVFFVGRSCFYALATSAVAREMSQYLDQTPWRYFERSELATLAGVLEFAWRIGSVPMSICLFVAYAVNSQVDDRSVRRRKLLWEAAMVMFGLEVLFQTVWWTSH